MAGRRISSRPRRTKVYDCNYSLGENYYKSAIDGLDRKYGSAPVETIEAPRRPVSADVESLMGERVAATIHNRAQAAKEEADEEMSSALKRIQKARTAAITSAEESFENAFVNRREEVKKRFSEKMLDSVGINGAALLEEEGIPIRRRAAKLVAELEDESAPRLAAKWTALRDADSAVTESLDELAAQARARRTRARLTDLENEMEQIAERGAARERRLANLRSVLDSGTSDTESIRISKKITVTEKRI